MICHPEIFMAVLDISSDPMTHDGEIFCPKIWWKRSISIPTLAQSFDRSIPLRIDFQTLPIFPIRPAARVSIMSWVSLLRTKEEQENCNLNMTLRPCQTDAGDEKSQIRGTTLLSSRRPHFSLYMVAEKYFYYRLVKIYFMTRQRPTLVHEIWDQLRTENRQWAVSAGRVYPTFV